MQKFHNILFVSNGIEVEMESLKQALSLADRNNAKLKALVISQEFPMQAKKYQNKHQELLADAMRTKIKAACDGLKIKFATHTIKIDVEIGKTPAIRIIRHVLKDAYDLVVKGAEPNKGFRGFKAVDMELLRSCPCPVWLCRPIVKHRDQIRVAVAIDPESVAQEGHDLSLRLLEVSRSLADTCSGELDIISCWDYELEEYLRQTDWINTLESELKSDIKQTRDNHLKALKELISKSGIKNKIHIDHMRGLPDELIPKYIEDNKVDILVMGTVARTGIKGFIIGNTAENVLQNISCSLLALKPQNFVSPITMD